MMAGYSYSDLPRPKKPHRPDKDTRHEDGVAKFRSHEKERKQVKFRARCLADTSMLNAWETKRANDLRERLLEEIKTGVPAKTLASATYHRELRMPIIGSWWKLVEEHHHLGNAMATLRPKRMLFRAKELYSVSPASLMKRLRNDLNRKGITAAPGFAFFGLDCDFDANRHGGVWDFHYHGVAVGEKIDALENLRAMGKYKMARTDPLERGLKPSPRIYIEKGLINLPSPITYSLESWYPHRPTSLEADGYLHRAPTKTQIPSPYFQQLLIWWDMWSIEDFILLSNLTPTKKGFRIITP